VRLHDAPEMQPPKHKKVNPGKLQTSKHLQNNTHDPRRDNQKHNLNNVMQLQLKKRTVMKVTHPELACQQTTSQNAVDM